MFGVTCVFSNASGWRLLKSSLGFSFCKPKTVANVIQQYAPLLLNLAYVVGRTVSIRSLDWNDAGILALPFTAFLSWHFFRPCGFYLNTAKGIGIPGHFGGRFKLDQSRLLFDSVNKMIIIEDGSSTNTFEVWRADNKDELLKLRDT